jgi:hypothetical protein
MLLQCKGQLMVCREIPALYSGKHWKQANTLCGQNVGFLPVKEDGTYRKYCALEQRPFSLLVVKILYNVTINLRIPYSKPSNSRIPYTV